MSQLYRPRVITDERGAYRITCKEELASSLLMLLNKRGVSVDRPEQPSWEHATYGGVDHSYRVVLIELVDRCDVQANGAIVDDWLIA